MVRLNHLYKQNNLNTQQKRLSDRVHSTTTADGTARVDRKNRPLPRRNCIYKQFTLTGPSSNLLLAIRATNTPLARSHQHQHQPQQQMTKKTKNQMLQMARRYIRLTILKSELNTIQLKHFWAFMNKLRTTLCG